MTDDRTGGVDDATAHPRPLLRRPGTLLDGEWAATPDPDLRHDRCTPSSVDVTDHLGEGGAELVVRADDDPGDGHLHDLDRAPRGGRAVVLSEFGGIALDGAVGWGCSTAGTGEELLRRYGELWAAVRGAVAAGGWPGRAGRSSPTPTRR